MGRKKGGHGGGGGGGHDAGGGLRWLLTYADMITLLLALFIYLYSISDINATKLAAASAAMREVFGIGKIPQSSGVGSGSSGFLEGSNGIVSIKHRAEETFKDLKRLDLVSTLNSDDGVVFRLRDGVLFRQGSAVLSKKAKPILHDVSRFLNEFKTPVRVSGHTDDLPVMPGGRYKTNLELSTARAVAVANYLIESGDIEASRVSVSGFGQYMPLKPNEPGKGNPVNRRVEITVFKVSVPGRKNPDVI